MPSPLLPGGRSTSASTPSTPESIAASPTSVSVLPSVAMASSRASSVPSASIRSVSVTAVSRRPISVSLSIRPPSLPRTSTRSRAVVTWSMDGPLSLAGSAVGSSSGSPVRSPFTSAALGSAGGSLPVSWRVSSPVVACSELIDFDGNSQPRNPSSASNSSNRSKRPISGQSHQARDRAGDGPFADGPAAARCGSRLRSGSEPTAARSLTKPQKVSTGCPLTRSHIVLIRKLHHLRQ